MQIRVNLFYQVLCSLENDMFAKHVISFFVNIDLGLILYE